nr:hypothetical protein [Psychrobacter sp. PraFG1]UNK05666.1 hypothetical protein MN210_02030 [Psychrobacter sp. PraFG1]
MNHSHSPYVTSATESFAELHQNSLSDPNAFGANRPSAFIGISHHSKS